MRLQKTNKSQYFITLPKILVEMKGWRKGEKLKFILNNAGQPVLLNQQEKVKQD